MDVTIFATLKKLIGTKTDTVGSATDGTVNGKLNSVITNTAASTSANASGTLSQKLTYIISTLIGATGATGGSATAGTIMSKLNALLTSWTSARAGYVDTINTNTATNNTASSTGVLSSKLSYIMSQRQASLTGIGTSVYTLPSTISMSENAVYCASKFVAPISGLYVINFTISISSARTITLYRYTPDLSVGNMYINTSIGYLTSSIPATYTSLLSFTNSATVATSKTFYFYCEAGEPVILVIGRGGSTGGINNNIIALTVTYQASID